MAPKHRIRKAPHTKSRIKLSTKRVGKKKLRDALQRKNRQQESEQTSAREHRPSPPQRRKPEANVGLPPARGSGRPSRFDLSEESFLKNVPEQLKQYAFRPGNQFAKGHGRPKGSISLTTRLRGLLATPIEGRAHPKGKAKVTYADELMSLALQAARRGDYRFFEHIYSRVEGKIPDHVVVEEVQRMVTQESEKLTEQLVKIVSGVVDEELGEKRGRVVVDKLTARITEQLGEKDAGRRAG